MRIPVINKEGPAAGYITPGMSPGALRPAVFKVRSGRRAKGGRDISAKQYIRYDLMSNIEDRRSI
jgi:hypothetical protein